jgi:hypothetical protein
MSEQFSLSLNEEEKAYLKDLVHLSILKRVQEKDGSPPPPPSRQLEKFLGAFVTLKRGGQLRGCIGHLQGTKPLHQTVWDMARSAAFKDPRFPPVRLEEINDLSTEISILGPIEPCPDPSQIEIGRHGLIVKRGVQQGLLLPQVATEWGWDREQFLEQTCLKAGLGPTAWREPGTEVLWFEAEVF